MAVRSRVLTRSQLSSKRTKYTEESGESTEDREGSVDNRVSVEPSISTVKVEHTVNRARVEPAVNTAYQHNASSEEHYEEKTEGHSRERKDGCIQENSETAMDHSTYKPHLEVHVHETATQYRIDDRHAYPREMLGSSDPNKRHEGLVNLRRRTCYMGSRWDVAADYDGLLGFLPVLMKCLTEEDQPKIQLEAAWNIANISSGTSKDTNAVVDIGAVPVFMQLLFSPVEEMQEQALIVIGCIAGESATLRDYVISLGALESVLKLLQGNYSKLVLRRVYWILLNFLAPTEPLLPLDDVQDILPVFCQLLDHNKKTQDLIEAVWAFVYLTETGNERLQIVLDYPNAVCRLVKCLEHNSEILQEGAARAIKNILRGTEEQLSTVRQCLGESTYNTLLKKIKKYKDK